MKNTKKTFIVSLLASSFLLGLVYVSIYFFNPSEVSARDINSQRIASKPKAVTKFSNRGGTSATVKKVGTREGGQPIYEVKIDGKSYVTGSDSPQKAYGKVSSSCARYKNCDNPSCHNVAEKNDKNSKYYKRLNPNNTPTTPNRVVPTTPTIRVINTNNPAVNVVGPGVTPLTLPGDPASIIPGLPARVTGTIDIKASIFPNIVNEGYKCKISYEVDNAVSCVRKTGSVSSSLFDSNDGSVKKGNIDVDPGTHTIECINDDNVPTQKVLTCVANVDTRED